MSGDSVQQYIRKLKKNLILPREHRQDFLEGLSNELHEYACEHNSCNYGQLEEAFGKPEYVAHQFIEQSDSADLVRHTKRRRMVFQVAAGILLILVVFLVIWISSLLRHTEVRVTETITESYRRHEYLDLQRSADV